MNKVAAAVLAAAMVGSMAVPAFAADANTVYGYNDENGNYTQSAENASDNGTRSRQTVVKYTVTSAYEWTIHSEVDLGKSNTDQEVQVRKCVIPESTKLQITVKGQGTNGAFEIKSQRSGTNSQTEDGDVTRTYTVQSDSGKGSTKSNIDANGVVMEVDAGTNSKTAKVDFALEGLTGENESETAGSYKGTVIYTANIVSSNT